jgi:hypothetical protein
MLHGLDNVAQFAIGALMVTARPPIGAYLVRHSRLMLVLFCVSTPLAAQDAADNFDPMTVNIRDALTCKIDAPTYNGFALTLDGSDKYWKKRGWKKVKSPNLMMSEYQLLAPVEVAPGYTTDRIAFTSSAVLAILDLADPAPLAQAEKIENQMDPQPFFDDLVKEGIATKEQIMAEVKFRKFLGERIVIDKSERDEALQMMVRTKVSVSLSTVTTHPGKTLYGCAYSTSFDDFPKK